MTAPARLMRERRGRERPRRRDRRARGEGGSSGVLWIDEGEEREGDMAFVRSTRERGGRERCCPLE
eukprot:2083320-Rhodomonas_salina.1